MEMSKIEKMFVNSSSHSSQVSEHAEKLLRQVHFEAGQRYLDVGCGNGAASIHLAQKFGLTATGIDVDPAQIQVAQKLSAGMNNVRFRTLDGTQLPFDEGSFDIVATNKVMHHVPNWQDAFAEMVRVLRPDGYLIYSDLVYPRWLARIAGPLIKQQAGFPTKAAIEALVSRHQLRKVTFSPSAVQVEAIFQR